MAANVDPTDYKARKKAWKKAKRRVALPAKILCFVLPIVFVATSIALYFFNWFPMTFDLVIGANRTKITNADESAQYYTSDYVSDEERVAAGKELSEKVEAEGATLLKNDDAALPLGTGAKVTLFSHSSVDIVYGGTGSAGLDTSEVPNLKEAMESAGFSVNPTMWDFYTTGAGSGEQYTRQTVSLTGSDSVTANQVNEVPWSVYDQATLDSVADYGDAAIVVLSRVGGEGYDLNTTDEHSRSGGYLGITDEERDLLANLKSMKEAGTVKKVVVLLNSSNPIQLDFLKDPDYDVDAVLWIGGVGAQGINAVGKILAGTVNPSGSLSDTFLYDNLSAPSTVNSGSFIYTNAEQAGLTSSNSTYMVYQEGIYVGYRYFETRYEDAVMGTAGVGDFSYSDDVAYGFGYGLSYTTFETSDVQSAYDASTDKFTVTATVTNTGSVAGSKSVQVYAQSPYTDYDCAHGIEKPAAQLVGFAKTKQLEPGESQIVAVSVDRRELASYDADGEGTYILESGDYLLTVADGAHAAANNFLAYKGYTPVSTSGKMDAAGDSSAVAVYTNASFDSTTYATSTTGAAIENRFDDADLNRAGYVGDQNVTYISRSDWENTVPTEAVILKATDEMITELSESRYDAGLYSGKYSGAAMPTTGAKNGLKLIDLMGLDYDDPKWDSLLDQLNTSDMSFLIGSAFHYTQAIDSIQLPGTRDENGPTGLTTTLFGARSDVKTMGLPSEDVMGATFNTELLSDVGRVIGNDCIAAKVSYLYGPGANIHRNAYCGRNFEYFSEDGLLSGKLLASEVAGIESKGCHVMIKHFALNDQETNRTGVCTWANEQAIREVYLRSFEYAFAESELAGVMTSYSRVGCAWNGADEGMIEGVLRGEWGCNGVAISDNSAISYTYMNGADAVLAGSDLFDSMCQIEWSQLQNYEKDPVVVSAMRDACHRIAYATLNSLAMNGIGAGTTVAYRTPTYVVLDTACFVASGLGFLFCLVFKIVKNRKFRQANPKPRRVA
ncbi:glycoside hydrolase family 3 C-terminal domain-containing protein [Paratractidigestivibacter sp.]|uniref:glycoside hydrolase family 3 C-terminal domain-containing protein n=1 Tax=Paratractidigestivibacter sp. TaxID=2847316 RepID=UPI002AC98303|nr:glycoside hydrolase family 3 C-terminal domain-containing protein [Paratractidigestivibacter sp.]